MPLDAALRQAMEKFLDDQEFRQQVIATGKDGGGDAVAQLLRDEGAELSQDDMEVIASIDWTKSERELSESAKMGLTQEGW